MAKTRVHYQHLTCQKASGKKILAVCRREYWHIETGLNYRRDVTFHEDATRMTKGDAGAILAIIHNLVLGLLKQAGYKNAAQGRRWFSAHIDKAFDLLTSSIPLS